MPAAGCCNPEHMLNSAILDNLGADRRAKATIALKTIILFIDAAESGYYRS